MAVLTACSQRSEPQVFIDLNHGCPPNEPPKREIMVFSGPAFSEFKPRSVGPDTITVFGYVRAAEDSTALPSVMVFLRHTDDYGRLSQQDGRYELHVPAARADTVVFAKIGYQEEILPIPSGSSAVRIDAELVRFYLCLE
jgi:hypothetical protein